MSIRVVAQHGALLTPTLKPKAKKRRRSSALVPAASRAATTLTPEELDLNGDAIETFTRVVGGRRELLETLSIADTDLSTDKVVACLLSDQYAGWSLRRICAHVGITVADLFASYTKALFVKAHVISAHIITARLPPIVADVMARALPTPETCPRCHGLPTTPDTSPCPRCTGTGVVQSEPDLDRQKLALELGRLTERRAGIVMQQNTIAAGAALQTTTPGSLEQLQQAVGELLFSPSRRRTLAPTIDAEPVAPACPLCGKRDKHPNVYCMAVWPEEAPTEPPAEDADGDRPGA